MFKTKKLNSILFFSFLISISIVCKISFESYVNYEKTIVNQQLQQLMTIAKSISHSIDIYLNGKMSNLYVFAHNSQFENALTDIYNIKNSEQILQDIKVLYNSQNDEIKSIFVISKGGEIISKYANASDFSNYKEAYNLIKNDIDTVLKEGKPYIGTAYMDNSGEPLLNLIQPVTINHDLQAMVVVAIKLNKIYSTLVSPVQIGEKGYAIIKDKNGVVLMHPDVEYIGYQVTQRIKDLYPGDDITEVEALVQLQILKKEGTYVYHSYWWSEKDEKVKKLNAFVSANQLNWIVSVVMSYDEVKKPIIKFLAYITSIAIILIFIFSFFTFFLLKMKKDKESYIRELNYQKELRKRDADLQHSRRLKTIGIMTGGIAHEFNNILTPILGYTELLINRVPEEIKEDMGEIYNSALSAKKLIEQIMPYSCKEDKDIEFEILQINDVINRSLKLTKTLLPSSCTIVKNITEDCGFIYGNNMQLNQVMMNLCTNAFHAMEEKGGLLTVNMSTVDSLNEPNLDTLELKAQKYIKISIVDTGFGMDKQTLDHIFDPFFTTKSAGQGTGLGLYIVYGIIAKHKGKICAHSEKGIGSAFHIYLPQYKI